MLPETPMTSLLANQLYPVLDALPAHLQSQIQSRQTTMTVADGTVLFDDYQPCRGFPFVLAGAIRVTKPAANGRELPLYRVLPGESCVITTSCLLGRQDYNARGTTEQSTTIALLPRDLFDELLGVAEFRKFVFELVASRVADLMQLIEAVAFQKLDQRLAGLLLGKGKIIKATHQQLADELGSVREMVSRLLKNFAEHGYVRLGREQIEILDPVGLRLVAGSRPVT